MNLDTDNADMSVLQGYLKFVAAYKSSLQAKYEVLGGVDMKLSRCDKCGNDTLVTELVQKRAADEEATETRWCMSCS